MNDQQFRQLIEASPVFQNFPKFKQGIFLQLTVKRRLLDLYQQADKFGIEYLKQNPKLTLSDVMLIESMLSN